MPDEFREHIEPIGGKGRIENLDGHEPPAPPPREPRTLTGRIVSVRVSRRHADAGEHRLDVTVGGGEGSEVVMRVSGPLPPNIEGKRAVLYIDD